MNAIEMKNITMAFGNFIALNKVDFVVKRETIHALIGENGAGKSTLMSILFGLYKQTDGDIFINGNLVEINSPLEANNLKIGMVHQHFKLVENMSVLENIVLNAEDSKLGIINYKNAKSKIKEIMKKYHFEVDLNKKIKNCSVSEQQKVEILKMLYRDADILIFDEPTAVLSPIQIDQFLIALENLKLLGKTIILISHKLDELKKVASKGTVIRRGNFIADVDIKKITAEKLSEMMVGNKVAKIENPHLETDGEVVVKLENLFVKKHGKDSIHSLENFNLEIKAGEIVAIAGVEGNGQQELIESITGLGKLSSGQVLIKNQNEFIDISKKPIKQKYKNGLAHIPSDRHKHGIILDFDLINNGILDLHSIKPYSRYGLLNFAEAKKWAKNIISKFDVRSNDGETSLTRTLSGGNQQKFIVGRELLRNSKFIVVAQPTRGLDVGAISNIHKFILKAKEKNKAILLVSYELDEVLSLSDRVIVLNTGKIAVEKQTKGVTKSLLGQYMTKQVLNV